MKASKALYLSEVYRQGDQQFKYIICEIQKSASAGCTGLCHLLYENTISKLKELGYEVKELKLLNGIIYNHSISWEKPSK